MKLGRYNFSPCQTDRTSVAQLHAPKISHRYSNLENNLLFITCLKSALFLVSVAVLVNIKSGNN